MVKTVENVGVCNKIHLNSVGDLLEPMNVPQLLDSVDNDGIIGQVLRVSLMTTSLLSIMAVTVQLQ
jgi:hypothetical protein